MDGNAEPESVRVTWTNSGEGLGWAMIGPSHFPNSPRPMNAARDKRLAQQPPIIQERQNVTAIRTRTQGISAVEDYICAQRFDSGRRDWISRVTATSPGR